MVFIQWPVRKLGKVLNRNQRILFVFLKRLCGRAMENRLQKAVTKKAKEEPCTLEMMQSWTSMVVVETVGAETHWG